MPQPDAYLATVDRLEPEITPVDRDAALASIAISLKRIADVLCGDETHQSIANHLAAVLADASHDHAQRMRP